MTDWTPELVERARYLWDQGVPASKIAKLIGHGTTKNSVIGKAHRGKWTPRRPSWPPKRRRKHITPAMAKKRERPPRPPKPKPEPLPPPAALQTVPIEDLVRLPRGTLTLLELTPGRCKWPTNDPPPRGGYLFCGDPAMIGRAYCEMHDRIGYQKGSAPRRAALGGWQPRAEGF